MNNEWIFEGQKANLLTNYYMKWSQKTFFPVNSTIWNNRKNTQIGQLKWVNKVLRFTFNLETILILDSIIVLNASPSFYDG